METCHEVELGEKTSIPIEVLNIALRIWRLPAVRIAEVRRKKGGRIRFCMPGRRFSVFHMPYLATVFLLIFLVVVMSMGLSRMVTFSIFL